MEEIARAKCREAARLVGGPVIVEDTALCFDSLGGLPGPYIKWFLAAVGLDGLVAMLAGFPSNTAKAVCTFAYSPAPDADPLLFQGVTTVRPLCVSSPAGPHRPRPRAPCLWLGSRLPARQRHKPHVPAARPPPPLSPAATPRCPPRRKTPSRTGTRRSTSCAATFSPPRPPHRHSKILLARRHRRRLGDAVCVRPDRRGSVLCVSVDCVLHCRLGFGFGLAAAAGLPSSKAEPSDCARRSAIR